MKQLALITLSIALAAPAWAAGGGGGGGGSMPSQSAPAYDPAAEYQKGVAALQAKDYKAAKTAFDRVTSAVPRDTNAHYLAGLARAGLNDLKGARKSYAKAVKLDANNLRAWKELGITDARLGDKPKAEETLAGIRAKSATCAGSCANAAEIKAAEDAVAAAINGTPAAARADESLLFASAKAGDGHYLEAVSLINERRYEDAIVSLEAARKSFGPHPDVLTYLGFAKRKLKRYAAAENYYRAALAIAPTHRGATEYFGELMVERGDLAGAKAMLAKLDAQCRFGCTEAEELRAWIAEGRSPHSS